MTASACLPPPRSQQCLGKLHLVLRHVATAGSSCTQLLNRSLGVATSEGDQSEQPQGLRGSLGERQNL